ncbi:hypothetical protein ACIRON_02615 [Nocardioides sp. NPDC101246]
MTAKFTPEEADAILRRLEAGELTHEIAASIPGCSPADIFWLWDERNRAR